jgi:hypothetical protein
MSDEPYQAILQRETAVALFGRAAMVIYVRPSIEVYLILYTSL